MREPRFTAARARFSPFVVSRSRLLAARGIEERALAADAARAGVARRARRAARVAVGDDLGARPGFVPGGLHARADLAPRAAGEVARLARAGLDDRLALAAPGAGCVERR